MSLLDFLPFHGNTRQRHNIPEDAYSWFSILYSGELSSETFEQYLDWAEKNPHKAAQVRELERIWEKLSDATGIQPAEPDNVVPPASSVTPSFRKRAAWIVSGFAAASIAIAGIVIVLGFPAPENEIYETARAETTAINLPDGSVANLNVLSRIEVHYTDGERQVELVRGEASFSVMPDNERPFIVRTGSNRIVALGTEFNTKIESGQSMVVTLVEGTIQVFSRSRERPVIEDRILDQPGLQAHMSLALPGTVRNARGSVAEDPITISMAELSDVLSWREGKLIFDGESLADAIQEINRHTTHTIRLQAPGIQDSPVYGVFNSGDWEGFLSAVELSYPLYRQRIGSNQTILTAR